MNPLEFLREILAQISTASPWALLLAKATLLLAVAWVVHFSLARANPRWRTLLWRGAVVGLVLWPFGLLACRAWRFASRRPSLACPTDGRRKWAGNPGD